MKKNKKKLEEFGNFIQETFDKNLPIDVLDDGSIVYKQYVICQDKNKKWVLHSNSSFIETFYLKATALLGAKTYNSNNLKQFFIIKELDNKYNQNAADSVIFKHFYKVTKDSVKRDNYLWRHEITLQRAKRYKAEIATMFKNNF